MVKPRLIKPMRVEILKYPAVTEAQNKIWRTPERKIEEIVADPDLPRVIIKAQVTFKKYEELMPVASGSNEDTDGYLVITEATQDIHRFKTNDHVIRLLGPGNKCRSVQLRVLEVRPWAQTGFFGLYRMSFKDDSRGQ